MTTVCPHKVKEAYSCNDRLTCMRCTCCAQVQCITQYRILKSTCSAAYLAKCQYKVILTSLVPSLKLMLESRVFLNSMEKRMYAVLGLLGASWSFLFLPLGEVTPSARVTAVVGSWGDATGGGDVGASCFRVSSYLAFSSAYLHARKLSLFQCISVCNASQAFSSACLYATQVKPFPVHICVQGKLS